MSLKWRKKLSENRMKTPKITTLKLKQNIKLGLN